MDPFVGQIALVAFNFAPRGWALAAGQLMPLSQNTALFSLLGTTYGGDGKSTFALPNLQDVTPISAGQGPGLSQYFPGEGGGSSTVTVLTSEIPAHNHSIGCYSADADFAKPGQAVLATNAQMFLPPNTPLNQQLNPRALSIAGGSLPHNNLQPYLGLNFIIALQGIFPQRQ